MVDSVFCKGCGTPIEDDGEPRKPCPKCGSTARSFHALLTGGHFSLSGGEATLTVVRKTNTETIGDFTRTAPVDVYGLACALGLEIKDVELGDDISGKIEKSWRSGYLISVNVRHPLTRRRFTAAHEIAHFVLHRDLIGDGIVDDAMYRSKKGDAIERQANAYAATILMPAPLVIGQFRAGNKSIADMAKGFEVSFEVAEIRMKELRLD
jgi:hypothetical protein